METLLLAVQNCIDLMKYVNEYEISDLDEEYIHDIWVASVNAKDLIIPTSWYEGKNESNSRN